MNLYYLKQYPARNRRQPMLQRWAALAALLTAALPALAANVKNPPTFDMSHVQAYIVAVFMIGVFVLVFYNLMFRFRDDDVKEQNKRQNNRLALVMQTGNLRLWVYDVGTRHYHLLSESGDYSEEYNPVDFSAFFNRDDFEQLRKAIFDISEGRLQTATVSVNSAPHDDGTVHSFRVNVSIGKRDARGKILNLLCIQHDVTDLQRRKENVNKLLMRYHTVFNTSLIDMAYYDRDGVLRDVNEKACTTFHVKNREEALNSHLQLAGNPLYGAVNLDHLEDTHSTAIIDYDSKHAARLSAEVFNKSGRLYYESTVNPITNSRGELEGIFMAGRNVTEMVESFHRQQEGFKKLQHATKEIEDNIRSINYALQVSRVRLVNYYPQSFTLEISNNINDTPLRLSQLRCIRLGTPRFRRAVSSVLNRMDHLTEHPVTLQIETELRNAQGHPVWMMFDMVPIKNEEGSVEHYFGTCRDITEIVQTEARLAVETKKAQETELLKQAFLTNMSYEIRTPLNTVVGFAELFESDHDEADEPLFVEEIKRNSNVLLKLVNDILYLSRLDANMIEYNMRDTDLALVFDGLCQMGWSNVSPQVKTMVENPYEHLVVSIDQEHLGTVIEKLCQGAVANTEKGSIRAKYDYRLGELAISVEDTGQGIDNETMNHVFDRFVRDSRGNLLGTGLDMPIVHELVEQMGGTIEIQSRQGVGTTVWVIFPCEAKVIEKRSQLLE